jgi:hypothetical protein
MIRAWLSLVFATYLIKLRNLEQISSMLRKRKEACEEEWSYREAEQAMHIVEKTKRFFLSRTACLEQSLALFLLATSKKKSVDFCVGVRLSPFGSHAWIEVNGIPVEETEIVKTFQKILIV